MQNNMLPVMGAPSSSPWTNLLNQLGPGILGGAGTYLSGKQLQGYTNDAVNAAGYKPTTISGPGGGITPTRNPDGSVSYGVTGTGAPALGPLSQFAGGAAGAGSDVLSAFKNFNPQQFAQDQYTNLASLQAPTNTNQTQQMLNYEQRTGRGGLTQNGQLGDLGGLDLSQRLGDTGLRMQAEQLASQRQGQLADTASRLGGAGTTALGGVSNYNSSLMDMLRTAMTGSTGQAYAGANQGRMMYDTGTTRANQTGNLFGSTLQGLANSGGGLGSSLSSIFNSLRGAFGGGVDPNNSGDMTNGMYNGGAFGGGAPYYDPGQADSSYGSIPQDTNGNPVWDTGMNFNAGDPSQGPMSFNSAGGEAASQSGPVDPSVSAGYASNDPLYGPSGAGPYQVPDSGSPATSASSANPMGGLSSALGIANSGLNIYNGLQRGGVSGYGSAALSAGSLAAKAGMLPSDAGKFLGPVGNMLGLYNALKQGGGKSLISAGMNAAQLYNSLSTLAGASGASAGGSSAAASGAAGGLAGVAGGALLGATMAVGAHQRDFSPNANWWNNVNKGLAAGPGKGNTYGFNGYQGSGSDLSAMKQYMDYASSVNAVQNYYGQGGSYNSANVSSPERQLLASYGLAPGVNDQALGRLAAAIAASTGSPMYAGTSTQKM